MDDRPEAVEGKTPRIETGCGWLYATITHHEGEAFEVFATMGKAGGCATSQTQAIGRLLSFIARAGGDISGAARQIKGISCHQQLEDGALSCADGIGKLLEDEIKRLAALKPQTGDLIEEGQDG